MTRPTDFGAQCEHGRLARKCERCDDADEIATLRDCAKQYEQWLAQDHATIADLRDRLALCRRYICRDCWCAIVRIGDTRCEDCGKAGLLYAWTPAQALEGPYAAACVSVGLRALCGRRLIDVGEVK